MAKGIPDFGVTMIKPDVIVTWPRNTDYPLWRQYIRDHRELLGNVIVVFMETGGGENYRKFITDAMRPDRCILIESLTVRSGEDWRNVAIHTALPYTQNNNWIWFTEQDFLFKNDYWIMDKMGDSGVIGITQGNRLHPACLFMRRDVLEKTHKFFGIVSGVGDHFYKMQEDIENLGIDPYILYPKYYNHWNGLSSNMYLVYSGQKPNYQPDEFYKYIARSLAVNVPISPVFYTLFNTALRGYSG